MTNTALYRHFDHAGALLYVGISLDTVRRTQQHRHGAHWFERIARIDIQWHESRAAAMAAEAAALDSERPEFNTQRPTGAARSHQRAFDRSAATSLRDCVAQAIYRRGLKRTAQAMQKNAGNLSVALRGGNDRRFGLDELEAYIQRFGDKTPIYYLVAKYLGDEAAARDQALGQVRRAAADDPDHP